MSKTAWIVIGVIVLLLLIIGFIYWKNKPLLDKSAGAPKKDVPKTASTNTGTPPANTAAN